MPRPPRDTAAGTFHVYTHSVWGYPALFVDDEDRLEFLRHLARVSQRDECRCIGFCLMGNHYHLIVDVAAGSLPTSIRDLNWAYARAFNRRHGLRGHVQFDRYGSRRIHDTEDLLGRYAYVMNNPVEARGCELAEDWPWSSHAGAIGVRHGHRFVDTSRILAAIGSGPGDPRTALREYVNLRRKRYDDAQVA